MQIIFFTIIFILVFLLIIFIAFGLTISGSSRNKHVKGGLIAGIIGVFVLVGFIFFFVLEISSSSGSGSSSSSFTFIPIFAGVWIPIMVAINAQKKKNVQSTGQTNVLSNSELQQDEIKNIRFCMNCGGQ